jgi:hypothetical protein
MGELELKEKMELSLIEHEMDLKQWEKERDDHNCPPEKKEEIQDEIMKCEYCIKVLSFLLGKETNKSQ